jgi:hypothetical protein
MVHLEMPVAAFSVRNFDLELAGGRQFIDIVVSDLSDFDPETQVFAERKHDAFIEVEYVGRGTQFLAVGNKTISEGVKSDLVRLNRSLGRERCKRAAMLVVDDAARLESDPGSNLPWSPSVRPLLANKAQL